MIIHNHQTIIESGNGTIETYPCISEDGIGLLCINSCEKGEIGITKPIDTAPEPESSTIIWAFKNIESLDVAIEQFATLRTFMEQFQNGELDFKEAH